MFDVGTVLSRNIVVSLKKFAEAHFAVGFAGFEETHRTHGEPGKTTGTGVKDFTAVGRYGRTCEDELADGLPVVDFVAYGIPEARNGLPLINHSRCIAGQYGFGVVAQQLNGVFAGFRSP